ncbi:MAG TPA: hypothetical protein VLG47_02870 [Candidatus Saccharimonadales bacterium]|nr:hypothetical protein [Candidatus Saccharimonadales bacterium]
MFKKIKLFVLATLVIANFGVATTAAAAAAPLALVAHPVVADFQSDACGGVGQVGGTGCGKANDTISNLMHVALNLLSLAAGFIAVVMVIISGIKFMTAAGDASQISSARQSLIYAMVGIIVAALAQLLVHFVFLNVTTKV